ncbi:TspO/MBR family protein [Dichotomicrobium thermohalophilum]|uniref:TspO/MBR related protein n=1 Tax=Dichotomicrobium thermohalophilum TaxID=933063 RepID=A0A397Q6L8_9HYPH|nr:TspO/MBR related protein [Dichotomicrobium thermohalophilum]
MSYLTFAVFFVIVLVAASSGAIFKPGEWYRRLRKPSWTPPDWAFPVVWSVLYFMIAVAGYLVWMADPTSPAMAFWAIQLVLNAAWSWLFFGRRDMVTALADVSGMWLAILGFIITAWPLSPIASLLFVPYLVWVSLASLLNFTVWRLNA